MSEVASGRVTVADREGRHSTVYGPVWSWRFGRSLGVDPLLVDSICSLDCVYCQLGRINRKTSERAVYVPTEWVIQDLTDAGWSDVDVVTFSGSGEPTLASNLGQMIRFVKQVAHKPVVVLTNATTLGDEAVRSDLAAADHVSCKIDAPRERQFQAVNRPAPGITLPGVLEGIRGFRSGYQGVLSIQVMLLPATAGDAASFATILSGLGADEVFVNVPSRESPSTWSLPARGAHLGFDHKRAVRLVNREAVEEFAAELRRRTGLNVVAAPVTAVSAEPAR